MMCVFCGNREKCWDQMSDEQLEEQWVKCGYDDYTLDERIELEDLLQESLRRADEIRDMEQERNVG